MKLENCWQHCLTQPCCQPVFPSPAFLFKCKTTLVVLHLYSYFSFTVTPPRNFWGIPLPPASSVPHWALF